MRETGHASATDAHGLAGPICINCFQLAETRPHVIWDTYMFALWPCG